MWPFKRRPKVFDVTVTEGIIMGVGEKIMNMKMRLICYITEAKEIIYASSKGRPLHSAQVTPMLSEGEAVRFRTIYFNAPDEAVLCVVVTEQEEVVLVYLDHALREDQEIYIGKHVVFPTTNAAIMAAMMEK